MRIQRIYQNRIQEESILLRQRLEGESDRKSAFIKELQTKMEERVNLEK